MQQMTPLSHDLAKTKQAAGRIAALDLARAGALVAMAVFHFVFDLALFGFIPADTPAQMGWRWLAYLTAGSFLFLAGVSLWLAHGAVIGWRAFWRRWVMLIAAACAITIATMIAMPDAFIFFGILHAIAAASLLGLATRRLSPLALIALAVAVIWLPQAMRFALFDPAWLWWTGLQATGIRSVDYVPLFPWFGPFLLGLACAKLMTGAGLWDRLAGWPAPKAARPLLWAGRNSLFVYLIHQPILIALVWGAAQLRP